MIPKIIHYCWFGGKALPVLAEKCIESWKKYCPDYKLMLWNESNFDLNSNAYVREAYDAKKFAFVTDYVRLWALYNYGGIYMDTDVEVLKPLDRFLGHQAFSGFESFDRVPTGIMASEQFGEWVARELEYYQGRHFLKEDGSSDMTTNVTIITNNLVKEGFKLNNTYQEHNGIVTMYPCEYFCPKDYKSKELVFFTENTHAIHHFSGSWLSLRSRLRMIICLLLQKRCPALFLCIRQIKKSWKISK